MSECSEPGCTEPVYVRGMCNRHYRRMLKRKGPIQKQTPKMKRRRTYSDRETRLAYILHAIAPDGLTTPEERALHGEGDAIIENNATTR